jgi:hypothetical protein
MKSIIFITALAVMFLTGTKSFSELEKSVGTGEIRVSVKTEATYNSLTDELGVNHSHIHFQWLNGQKITLQEANELFKKSGATELRANKVIFNLSVKLSAAPYLVKESSEEKALGIVSDKIEVYRDIIQVNEDTLNSQIENAIDSAILTNPALAPFRNSLIEDAKLSQQALYDQIEVAKTQVNQQEIAAKNNVTNRLDQLVTETTYQEIAIELGYILSGHYLGGEIALFARIGKFSVNSGNTKNSANQSELESVTAQNVLAQRGMGTSGTTAIQLSKVYRAKTYSIQGDLVVFHDRIPWLNAEQYVNTILNMDDSNWEKHDDLGDIDSAIAKILFENERMGAYIAAGNYDGENSYGVGFLFKISKKDTVYLDHYNGKRKNTAKRGSSLYYVHEFEALPIFGKDVSAYIGGESYKEVLMPHIYATEVVDFKQFGLGTRKKGKMRILNQKGEWVVKTGIYNIKSKEFDTGKELDDKNYGVFSFNFVW